MLLCMNSFGQGSSVTVQIGHDSILNPQVGYPAPYGNWYEGAEHQFIISANELIAEGLSAGPITDLSFDVAVVHCCPLRYFKIAFDTTYLDTFALFANFHSGCQQVFYDSLYTPVVGWNTHHFDSAYIWDGVSNLIVQTCFWNAGFSNNCVFHQSYTANQKKVIMLHIDGSDPCGQTTQNDNNVMRPNMRFTGTGSCSASFTVVPDTTPHLWWAINNAFGIPPITYSWNWGDGSSPSSGATPSHTYSAPGYYNICLTITDSVGCTSSHCDSSTYIYRLDASPITVNVIMPTSTSINSELHIRSILLSPNPTSSSINLTFTSNQNANIHFSLLNLLGEKMMEENFAATEGENHFIIPVSQLPRGIYFLKMEDGKETMSRMVAVE